MNKNYATIPKKNYASNQTKVCHIDDTWNMNLLNLKDYGARNNKRYRFSSVIFNDFSKPELTLP